MGHSWGLQPTRGFAKQLRVNQSRMVKGAVAGSGALGILDAMQRAAQNTHSLISPGMLVGYYDPIITTPESVWGWPRWLWTNWRAAGVEMLKSQQTYALMRAALPDKDTNALKRDLAGVFEAVHRHLASADVGALHELCTPLCAAALQKEYTKARKAREIAHVSWRLARPLSPDDVQLVQARTFMVADGPGWFQLAVRIHSQQLVAWRDRQGVLVRGNETVPSTHWDTWIFERATKDAPDIHWRLCARFQVPPPDELTAQAPNEQAREASDALWLAQKAGMANTMQGWLVDFLDRPAQPRR